MPYPPRPPLRPPDPWIVDGRVLRLPHAADVAQLAAICADPAIRRFTRVPSPYTEDDARTWVATAAEGASSGDSLSLVVAERDRVLASVGLTIEWRDAVGEVGYWAAPAARGRGVVPSALRRLCAYAFEQVGLPRLQLQAAATNPSSQAVAHRLGFVHEGTLRAAGIDGDSGDRRAPRVDMLIFGLLPGELRSR